MSIIFLSISQQLENCENRNDPDLVQASLKKWWVESDFKVPPALITVQSKKTKQNMHFTLS
jgi:hypothetical protein